MAEPDDIAIDESGDIADAEGLADIKRRLIRRIGNGVVAPVAELFAGAAYARPDTNGGSIADAFRVAPARGQIQMIVGANAVLRPGDMVALDPSTGRVVLGTDPGMPSVGVVERVEINQISGGAMVATASVRLQTSGEAWLTPPCEHHAGPPRGWALWSMVEMTMLGSAIGDHAQLARRVVGRQPGFPRLGTIHIGALAVCSITSDRACDAALGLRRRRRDRAETDRAYLAVGALSVAEVSRDLAGNNSIPSRSYRRRDVRRALRLLAPHLRVASDAMLEGRRGAAIAALAEVIPLRIAEQIVDANS